MRRPVRISCPLLGNDEASVQPDGRRGQPLAFGPVSDQDQGDAGVGQGLVQDREHELEPVGFQVVEQAVDQPQLGPPRRRPGERPHPAMARLESVRPERGFLRHPQPREDGERVLLRLVAALPAHEAERERHVLEKREVRDQVARLRHPADAAPAEKGMVEPEGIVGDAFQDDPPPLRVRQSGAEAQQHRRPVSSQTADADPRPSRQAPGGPGEDDPPARRPEGHLVEEDERLSHSRPSTRSRRGRRWRPSTPPRPG